MCLYVCDSAGCELGARGHLPHRESEASWGCANPSRELNRVTVTYEPYSSVALDVFMELCSHGSGVAQGLKRGQFVPPAFLLIVTALDIG